MCDQIHKNSICAVTVSRMDLGFVLTPDTITMDYARSPTVDLSAVIAVPSFCFSFTLYI